jgi:hypothetical protein
MGTPESASVHQVVDIEGNIHYGYEAGRKIAVDARKYR